MMGSRCAWVAAYSDDERRRLAGEYSACGFIRKPVAIMTSPVVGSSTWVVDPDHSAFFAALSGVRNES
jgi:hypothetical protein